MSNDNMRIGSGHRASQVNGLGSGKQEHRVDGGTSTSGGRQWSVGTKMANFFRELFARIATACSSIFQSETQEVGTPAEAKSLLNGKHATYGTFDKVGASDKTKGMFGRVIAGAKTVKQYMTAGLDKASAALVKISWNNAVQGARPMGTIVNVAQMETIGTDKLPGLAEKRVRAVNSAALQRSKDKESKKMERSSPYTGKLPNRPDFSNVDKAKMDGNCAGIRAGLAKSIVAEGKSMEDSIKKYSGGADEDAIAFQAVYSEIQVVTSPSGLIGHCLESMPRQEAQKVAYLLDQVCVFQARGEESNTTFQNGYEFKQSKDNPYLNVTPGRFYGENVEPKLKCTQKAAFGLGPVDLGGSVQALNQLKQSQGLSEDDKKCIDRTIAILTIVKDDQTKPSTSEQKAIRQMNEDYKTKQALKFAHLPENLDIVSVPEMRTSAFCKTDSEFLDKITRLKSGFYGINIATEDVGHAINLQITGSGKCYVVDPNGVALECDNVGAAIECLKKIVMNYGTPDKNVGDNHHLAIFGYKANRF